MLTNALAADTLFSIRPCDAKRVSAARLEEERKFS